MKTTKFALALIASLAMTAFACDDDKKDNSDNNNSSCDANTVLECASSTARTECKDGKLTHINCGEGQTCSNNTCSGSGEAKSCDSQTKLECASETAKTECQDSQIVPVNCGEGQKCSNNTCIDDNLVGQECTVDVCYKNIPHYCDKSKTPNTLFVTYGDHPACQDGTICQVSDGLNAFCLEPCTQENEKKFVCGQNQLDLYSAEGTCKKFPDGQLAVYVDESDPNIEYCYDECVDGHCTDVKPTTADQGKDCDKATYGYHCDENKLVFCDSFSHVAVSDCGDRVCKTDKHDPKNSACVATTNCDSANAVTYECKELEENDTEELLVIRTCIEATDGKKYLFSDQKHCEYGSCTTEGACTEP